MRQHGSSSLRAGRTCWQRPVLRPVLAAGCEGLRLVAVCKPALAAAAASAAAEGFAAGCHSPDSSSLTSGSSSWPAASSASVAAKLPSAVVSCPFRLASCCHHCCVWSPPAAGCAATAAAVAGESDTLRVADEVCSGASKASVSSAAKYRKPFAAKLSDVQRARRSCHGNGYQHEITYKYNFNLLDCMLLPPGNV